jgi:FG-GAP repeat protein
MIGPTGSARMAMDRSAVGVGPGLLESVPLWRLLTAALVSIALAVALATALAQSRAGARSGPYAVMRPGPAARVGLADLPAAAEGPVSRALGAADPAYGIGAFGGAFRATNPAQRLHAAFSRSGVRLASGAVGVGLRLGAAGYGGSHWPILDVAPQARANQVRYARSGLVEWYANGPLGLEQGFTILRAPSHRESGPLTLSLSVSGGARASLAATGRSVTLARVGGRSLSYGELVATDARGRSLRSWLEVERGAIVLRVDSRGARYPLSVDPLIQQGAKLVAGGGIASGFFGDSVAISADGKTALIGASSIKTSGGTAWVFTRSGSTWTQQGLPLTGEECGVACGEEGGEAGEEGFGRGVALSPDGNTAVIGAPRVEKDRGAAWVFTRSGSTWTRGQKLSGSTTGKGRFGRSVALSADGLTVLIGSPALKNFVGDARVFTRSSSTSPFTQQGSPLTGGQVGPMVQIRFGLSVALSSDGNTALIGGPREPGAVWVFTRSGLTWTERQKLSGFEPSSEGTSFGGSVALSVDGSTALVGGRSAGGKVGAAWVFARSGSSFTQQGAALTGGEEDGQGEFGASAALSATGNIALIGGPGDGEDTGAAWEFARSGSTWTPLGKKRVGEEESRFGSFGASVALSESGTTAMVGGPRDTGKAGAAWAFREGSEAEEPREEKRKEEQKQKEEEKRKEEQKRSAESGSGGGGAAGSTGGIGGVLGFGPTAATCKVALLSKTITVLSHSRAAIKLRRTGAGAAACTGTLKLIVKTKISKKRTRTTIIGTGKFAVPPGAAQTVKVALNGAGRALLRAGRGRLGASLVIVRLAPHPVQAQTASVRLALAKPHTPANKKK